MLNIDNIFDTALEMCWNENIPVSNNIISVKVNTRATSRWGQCKNTGYGYKIEIAKCLIDSGNENACLNTMVHELIHTCPNCMNHGKKWQEYAERINKAYSLGVKRCSSDSEKGVKMTKNYKWEITCNGCKHVWKYERQPNIAKRPHNFTCSCGNHGDFKVVHLV